MIYHCGSPSLLVWLITRFIGLPPDSAVFTYGRHIWTHALLEQDLVAHEQTHMRQQGRLPWLWWARYLLDRQFRLRQELEAYQSQWAWVQNRMRRRYHAGALARMSTTLAGHLYGDLCTVDEARALIRPPRERYARV